MHCKIYINYSFMLNWTDQRRRMSEHTLSMQATGDEEYLFIYMYVFVKETKNSIYKYKYIKRMRKGALIRRSTVTCDGSYRSAACDAPANSLLCRSPTPPNDPRSWCKSSGFTDEIYLYLFTHWSLNIILFIIYIFFLQYFGFFRYIIFHIHLDI